MFFHLLFRSAIRKHVEILTEERDDLKSRNTDLETRLEALNVDGVQLLLNQVVEIQKKLKIKPDAAENGEETDLQRMYESCMKERDGLRLKVNQFEAMARRPVVHYPEMVAASGHTTLVQPAHNLANQPKQLVQANQATIQTIHQQNAQTSNQVHCHQITLPSRPDLNSTVREPQILLFEGPPAQHAWTNF